MFSGSGEVRTDMEMRYLQRVVYPASVQREQWTHEVKRLRHAGSAQQRLAPVRWLGNHLVSVGQHLGGTGAVTISPGR